MRIVFDTNIYLAATKEGSFCSNHLKKCQPNGPTKLFISPKITLEVQDKLISKFNYSTADAAGFIDMIMMYATMIYPKKQLSSILNDKDDHIILECALEAKADILFTADKELLRLKEYGRTKIAHPTMLQ